ncbi:MAG: hypothetical protein ACRC6B_12840, partial [Fusobacteriaceae bacterium]
MKQLRDTSQLEIQNILFDCELEYEDLQKIYFYYNMYLCSDKEHVKDLKVLKEEDKNYLVYVDKVYKYHRDNYVAVPHNFYLKQFSLTKPKLYGYDTICLDECQDINDSALNVVTGNNMDKKIIAVGDTAQSIFNFMHCKNALRILRDRYDFKEYKLTMSFRISDKIAGMCSRLLNWFYDEDMTFKGNNNTELKKIDYSEIDEQVTILSRTRLGALLEVLSILSVREDAKFYYYGGLQKYDLDKVENMLKYDGFIFIDSARFHVNTLRKMVKDGLDDPIIRGIISRYDFIKKNTNCLANLKDSETKDKSKADFCLNTLHGSKGSTYDIVKFAEDIGGVASLKDKYIESKDLKNEYATAEIS